MSYWYLRQTVHRHSSTVREVRAEVLRVEVDGRFGAATHLLLLSRSRSACGAPWIQFLIETTVTQHEHAVEAVEDLVVVGHGNDGRVVLDGELAQQVHDDAGAL